MQKQVLGTVGAGDQLLPVSAHTRSQWPWLQVAAFLPHWGGLRLLAPDPEISDMWAVNWQLGLSSHLAVDMWILLGVSILFHLFVSFYYYYFTRKLRGERGESVTVRNVPAIGSLPKWPQQ